jgi:hypothetical protein
MPAIAAIRETTRRPLRSNALERSPFFVPAWEGVLSKQPIMVEVYAWNEVILALIGLGWSTFIAAFQFEPSITDGRLILGLIVGSGALALLLVQNGWLKTLLDFTIPVRIARYLPRPLAMRYIKLWPTSAIIRVNTHFWFALWWALLGTAISLNIHQLEDVRLVFYFGLAAFHFDRLMRLLFWLRQ